MMHRHMIGRMSMNLATVVLVFLQLQFLPTSTAQKYYDFRCSDNYTSGGAYQANVASLFQNVTSQASLSLTYTGSFGAAPNEAFSGYFCREDIALPLCRSCLGNATQTILHMCPDQIAGVIWYDVCTLGFSPVAFSPQFVDYFKIAIRSNQNVSGVDAARFDRLVNDTMEKVAAAVVAEKADHRFATLEANLSGRVRVYALGQCSPVLATAECGKCLREGIGMLPGCCGGRDGGRVLFPTCNIRYETFQFYNLGAPPSSSSSSAGRSKEGKRRGHAVGAIVGSVVGGVVMLLILAIWIAVYRRKQAAHLSHSNLIYLSLYSISCQPHQYFFVLNILLFILIYTSRIPAPWRD